MPSENGKRDEPDGIEQEGRKALSYLVFKRWPRAKTPLLIIVGVLSVGGTATAVISRIPPLAKLCSTAWDYIVHPGGIPQEFDLSCKDKERKICPFQGIRNPAIDDSCGNSGDPSDLAERAENEAKNNFCVSSGTAKPMTYQDLIGLGQVTNLNDRTQAQSMGEGNYVSYIAFVGDAGPSDADKGEPVNCKRPNRSNDDNNDIYISLVENQTDPQSPTVRAEISPHYRPPSWSAFTLNHLTKVKPYPVRVQGQLFFDGHCTNCSAVRWEIHPVYTLDVCKMKTLAECRSSKDPADWKSLSDTFR